MTPDYQNAAIKAAQTLIDYKITATPVSPLPILKKYPGVIVVPFAEVAHRIGMERENLIDIFGNESRAAVTTIRQVAGETMYIVTYNQQIPFVLLQRALARELGHIVLGHDGSRPVDVRMAEAYCFALHLLCPRPLIHALKGSLTVETLGNLTGCYQGCVERMHRLPGVHVPPELNRKVKAQFSDYVKEFMRYHDIIADEDHSAPVDFGAYMEGYEE